MTSIAKDIIQEGGYRNFYRCGCAETTCSVVKFNNNSSGFRIIFIRALPVNAAMFLTYEWTMNSLVRWDRGGRWV